ncbi:hypothetical protein [Candidatus Thiodiazotropha endoloripes]|nr:hypothetical protein [Candidatus Thiodiazotropha endoloripes]
MRAIWGGRVETGQVGTNQTGTLSRTFLAAKVGVATIDSDSSAALARI